MSTKKITKRLLQTSILAGALTAVAMPAVAQDDEIVITGSRIAKKDFTSNSPVATVGSAQIDITGTVNTESLLNTLPQTVPGLDRTSNNPGNGTATVDLRGLGTARTLVLIDGLRAVPTTQGGTVDINNIPTSLIESIEVLTGGGGAAYGSDAVAGVVNFILKDDFEGMQLNAGYEQTQDSDAKIWSTDLTIGANTGDGRGNVVLNMAWNDRDELFQGDRDFSFFAQFDDGAGGLINGGSSGVPGTSIFAGAVGTSPPTTLNCPSFGIVFDPDGSARCFDTASVTGNDFYNYAPVNYIQLPQERFQATSLASYEINDHAEVYGRATYTYSRVPQQLAATPIFQTTTFTIDGSPFLPSTTQANLSEAFGDGVDSDSDGIDDTGTAFVRRRLLEVGPRIADSLFNTFQFVAGVKGDINDNWDYDVYMSEGTVTGTNTQNGNVNRDRFNQALLLDLAADPSGGTCVDPSANGATTNCAPINIFGQGNISDAGAAFLNTAVAAGQEYNQFFIGAGMTGTLEGLSFQGGPVQVAFGAEYRDEDADFRPSQDLAAGTIAGFNGSPAQGGAFDVYEIYGEMYVPLVAGKEWAELLELELQYRYSDYSTVGGVNSYKIGGTWAPTDQFRFRGAYNTSVRAPSIGELFSPQGENFPGATDPCAAEGPNAGDPAVQAICIATGVPAAAVNTPGINLPAGQVRALAGGNPNLTEESADTYTIGVVVEPASIPGLTFSVDYFDIEIQDVITQFGGSATNVLQTCYDPANALGGVGSNFCNVVNRRADGTINFVALTLQNSASQTLKGVDIIGEWDFDLGSGNASINYVGTFTQESEFISFTGATPIECAGNFGLTCDDPLPDYKHRATFSYAKDRFNGQILWRYIGGTDDDDPSTLFTVESLDAENYFDASASYEFNDSFKATFGIDNLFDVDPPIIGDNQEQANTYPATYDVFGRTFFVRGTLTK